MQGASEPNECLLAQFAAGDRRAGEALCAQLRGEAVKVARRILGRPEDVEDVVQEALCLALTRLAQLGEPRALAGWMRAIALNQCRQHLRSVGTRQLLLLPELGEHSLGTVPAADPCDLWLRELVATAISKLPPSQRAVVEGHYVAGRSQRQVAEEMQLPLATVKSRLQKARRNLRKEMLEMTATGTDGSAFTARLGPEALRALCIAARFTMPASRLRPEAGDVADPAAEGTLERRRALAHIWVGPHGVVATDTHRLFAQRGSDFAPLGHQVLPACVGDWLDSTVPHAREAVLAIADGQGRLAVSPDQSLEFRTSPQFMRRFEEIPADFADTVQPEWTYTLRLGAAPLLEALLRYGAFMDAAPAPGAEAVRGSDPAVLVTAPGRDQLVLSPPRGTDRAAWDVQVLIGAQIECTTGAADLAVCLNRHYLADCTAAVAQAADGDVEIRVADGMSALTFRPVGAASPVAVMMPMLLPETDAGKE